VWRIFILCCLPLAGLAEERWTSFQAGPFEVFTDAGAKPGREVLVRFEQLRNALGQLVGDDNLTTPQPLRIFVFKTAREAGSYPTTAPLVTARDRYAILLTAGAPVPPGVNRETTRLLMEANTARMPQEIERGLLAVFSTIDVSGIKTTLGRPVPAAERTKDWALVEMLATDPEYYGKLRVILYNLRRGVDPEAAYRNAVGKSPAEIAKLADQFLAAGNFQPVSVSARPMSERDFEERPVEPAAARLALADLLLGKESRAAYEKMIQEKVNTGEAWEGLGLLALHAGQKDAARANFAKAMEADSKSAGAYIEYARLEPDKAKAFAALEKAIKLNPKLAEPHILMAARESDLDKRIVDLQAAVKLDARNAGLWQSLAESYLALHNYGDASKAWRAAEQAATDDAQRQRYRQARLSIEQQRLDYEAAERRRQEEEKQRELEHLKVEARAQLHAAEAKANQGGTKAAPEKVVPWWEGPKPSGRVQGTLKQVDCLGKQLRLVVATEGNKNVRLLVPDAAQVAIMGGGEQTLTCGPQKARRVSVEYFPKANARLSTVGEVATIEFQ
jgi:tetratricopeptide (TPR) repeat protein